MNVYKASCAVLVIALYVGGFAVSPAASEEKPPAEPKVDLGSFTREIMVLKMEGRQLQLAMWLPFEFFVHATAAEAGTTRAQAEGQLKFLNPYHVIVVQCGITRDDGSTAYASQKEVRGRAVLKPETGDEIAPIDKVPPLVSATVEAMKAMMGSEGDEGGANLHVLVFPAAAKDGKMIIDASRKGKLTLLLKGDERFKETQAVWRTPFDATTPVPPCAKCKESVSAKWSYCPWCGVKLESK